MAAATCAKRLFAPLLHCDCHFLPALYENRLRFAFGSSRRPWPLADSSRRVAEGRVGEWPYDFLGREDPFAVLQSRRSDHFHHAMIANTSRGRGDAEAFSHLTSASRSVSCRSPDLDSNFGFGSRAADRLYAVNGRSRPGS